MARTALRLCPVTEATDKLDLKPGTNVVPINAIRLRRDGDARPLSAAHVVTLAESIAALGILEPVVVDLEGHLLAGGHRLAALQLLAESMVVARRHAFLNRLLVDGKADAAPAGGEEPDTANPAKGAPTDLADRVAMIDVEAFTASYPNGKVPVVAVDTSGKDGPGVALAVEAAENSIRRQYSRDEVAALAARLAKAGYVSRAGRPRKGEKSARPVLESLLGCSGRHLSRLLGQDDHEQRSEWDRAVAALLRAAKRVQEAGKRRTSESSVKVVDLAEKVSKALASE